MLRVYKSASISKVCRRLPSAQGHQHRNHYVTPPRHGSLTRSQVLSGNNFLSWKGAVMGSFAAGCAVHMVLPGGIVSWNRSHATTATNCESAAAVVIQRAPTVRVQITDHGNESFVATIQRILRVLRRILKLSITLSPIVALYPLQYFFAAIYPKTLADVDTDAHDIALASLAGSFELPNGPVGWYYKVCLYCVEWSGAAAIKMMQWAGSRPDMFGHTFCAIFSQLQDDTSPHSWRHTERLLRKAFGPDWEKRIRLDKIIGSGCIAQVYKGIISDEDGNERSVAVKVMHPNVEDDIDADLDIMRIAVHVLERLPFQSARDLQWINLPGFVEEIAGMLKIQLDLRTEAVHLERFQKNFEGNDLILFPQLVNGYRPTKEVLVETFCEGEPINDFIRTNSEKPQVLRDMCVGAIRAVCQMIFVDNFTHADLHPGNILVNSNKQFVLLDAGIVVEHSKRDHRLISDVLAAFIRRAGRRAGERMMEDSNHRMASSGERSVDEEEFLDRIESLTERAHGKDYFMQHLGTYITFICDSAARHHVMLNQAFISAALAVKVQEGIALALDPTVEVWRLAIPVILEGERKHGYAIDHAKEVMGIERVTNWVKGVYSNDGKNSSNSRS